MRDLLSKYLDYLFRVSRVVLELVVNFRYSWAATLGNGSRFLKQASVVNMQKDKTKIVIGRNSRIRGELLVFRYGGEIQIGDVCYIGEGTRLWSGERITIGNYVGIAHNVT